MRLGRIAGRSLIGRATRGAGGSWSLGWLLGQWLIPRKPKR